jgi:uncharacterized protein (UPF0276 family)
MTKVAESADCLLCFDSGHLYGHAHIARAPLFPDGVEVPWDRVVELHISGTQQEEDGPDDTFVDDAHPWEPIEDVWAILQTLVDRSPNVRVVVAEAEGMAATGISTGLRRIAGMLEAAAPAARRPESVAV